MINTPKYVEVTQRDLVRIMDMPRPFVSLYLRYLRARGLAERCKFRRREGKGRPAVVYKIPVNLRINLLELPPKKGRVAA